MIDVKKVVEDNNLDVAELAALLFPKNKHPKMSLDCVMRGEQLLNSEQLLAFAKYVGVPIGDLFTFRGWQIRAEPLQFTFSKGEYRAVLNQQTFMTALYHKERRTFQEIVHKSSITMSEYVARLDELITKTQ